MRDARVLNELHTAADGDIAIAYLRREGAYADATRPDPVILDLNLPRMDGRELLAEMKADNDLTSIPVIILTTSSAEADASATYCLQAAGFVTRPVNVDVFLAALRGIEDFWLSLVRLPGF